MKEKNKPLEVLKNEAVNYVREKSNSKKNYYLSLWMLTN